MAKKRSYRYQLDVSRGDHPTFYYYTRSYRYRKNALRNAEETQTLLEEMHLTNDDIEIQLLDNKTGQRLFFWRAVDSLVEPWS